MVLCHVEHVLLINFGKWFLSARRDESEFFISDSGSISPNLLPMRIATEDADKIEFIGQSVLRLTRRKVDLQHYRSEATSIMEKLKLKAGELDEYGLQCPNRCLRFNWRNFATVLNQLETAISSYTWQVFIEQGNLIKELDLFKQIIFLTR